jgi:hypothetical protein
MFFTARHAPSSIQPFLPAFLMNIVLIWLMTALVQMFKRDFQTFQIYTMFTKGQPRQHHLLQYFGSKHNQLWITSKNFESGAA